VDVTEGLQKQVDELKQAVESPQAPRPLVAVCRSASTLPTLSTLVGWVERRRNAYPESYGLSGDRKIRMTSLLSRSEAKLTCGHAIETAK